MDFFVKVYHEDVDGLGVVYHSNYIKYFERARSEWLGCLGFNQKESIAQGLLFVVHSLAVKYHRPAYFSDSLVVRTTLVKKMKASLVFSQIIYRDEELLCEGEVVVVSVDASFKVVRLPRAYDIRKIFL